MVSHLEATLARIQQIESRLQMLTNPPITSEAASAPDPNTLSGMMSSTDSLPTSIAPFPLTLQAALTNLSTTAPHSPPTSRGSSTNMRLLTASLLTSFVRLSPKNRTVTQKRCPIRERWA